VPLFDLKFLTEFAADAVGTSNRRHQSCMGLDDVHEPARSPRRFPSGLAIRRALAPALDTLERRLLIIKNKSALVEGLPVAFPARHQSLKLLENMRIRPSLGGPPPKAGAGRAWHGPVLIPIPPFRQAVNILMQVTGWKPASER
jgi:hypothetical protein